MITWFIVGVWPNLVASLIWATPAFTIHHVLMKKHIAKTVRGHHHV